MSVGEVPSPGLGGEEDEMFNILGEAVMDQANYEQDRDDEDGFDDEEGEQSKGASASRSDEKNDTITETKKFIFELHKEQHVNAVYEIMDRYRESRFSEVN
mmetsp:Transcript_47430/g.34711  ORF Transcript_47430/g.34711 Transcript_47430/m.34711 type:complete len:101 (+) Transcript_47430:604-906(+)